MDKKDETISDGKSGGELDPGIQALAGMADKMGEGSPESEYNEFGFNSEGVHKNGTQYDDEGYGTDGFDEDGVDREGFDREGFGSDERDRDGFDREGYGKDGYDRKGFDKTGTHRGTGTEYDGSGYNREGFDKYGYDRGGYDKEGFRCNGFNREGIHKTTGTEFGPNGWNQYQTTHRDTGDNYDPEGFNGFGRDRDGYDREGWNVNGWNRDGINKDTNTRFDRRGFDVNGINEKTGEKYDQYGFDRAGINKETGTKFDNEGFDIIGLDRDSRDRDGFRFYNEGTRRDLGRFGLEYLKRKYPFLDERSIKTHPINYSFWVQHSAYNKNGFDRDGCDKDGYDHEGYNKEGFNKNGYNREGLDKDGYTEEYNAKFNKYGVDENGYMKNGEMDPDVEFAISFSESGIKDQIKYAAEKGIDEKEVRERIELARKKCPNIDEIIKNLLLTGNKMRVAAISNDCEKFINGKLNVNDFWDKHPKLNIAEVLFDFIIDPDKRKQFANRTVENIVLDSDNIERNLRIFGTSQYDVSGALKGIEDFKRIYARFGTDGIPEQIQKKRENTKKIFDTIKYLNKYKNRNLDSLLGSRQSFDGGQTWVEFNGETIGQAMDALKNAKKLICVQTVKDYIINQSKNSEQ